MFLLRFGLKLSIFLCVLALMIISCTESQKQLKNDAVNLDSLIKASPKQDTLQYILHDISKVDSSGIYAITAVYPEIINYPDPGKRKMLNSLIEMEVFNSLDAFLIDVSDTTMIDKMPYDFINLLTMDFKFYSKNLKFASLLFNIRTYNRNAHHPVYYHKSLNYDLVDGVVVTLDSIFPNDTTFWVNISSIAAKKLLADDKLDSNWVKTGTLPVSENYPNFNLSKDNLIITFDIYQVANFADGAKKIYIPWSELPNADYKKFFPELSK